MNDEVLTEPIVEPLVVEPLVAEPLKPVKKHFEFSKFMALIAIGMWLSANIFGMAMMVYTLDLSPMAYVIPSVDAVVACTLVFYYKKAGQENQIKLKRIYGLSDNEFSQIIGGYRGDDVRD